MTYAIDIDNVSFSFDGQPVIDHVTLRIPQGQFVGLIGPNGGGKSTLLRLILGLLAPQHGRIRLFGETPTRAARRIGYVPQFARFARSFPISVEDVVLMGLLGKRSLWGPWRRHERQEVGGVLDLLEISHLRQRHIDSLSGGQLQRVLLARALAAKPDLLLLDEPTASVDSNGERSLFELFARLKQEMTMLLISHDLGFISNYVDQVVCLNRTLLAHPTESITADTIARLYGEQVQMIHHHH